MATFVEIGLTNAILAAALGLVVLGVTRIWKNPHLAHGLWLIVLLKLVTPPVVDLPLPINRPTVADDGESIPAEPVLVEASEERPPVDELSTPSPELILADAGEFDDTPVNLDEPPAPAVKVAAIHSVEHNNEVKAPTPWPWTTWVGLAWLGGSLLWMAVACGRIVRFHRTLGRAQLASAGLQTLAQEMAAALKLRRCPRLRLVDNHLSPMVWPLGRKPTVIVPKKLVDVLDEDELKPVLAHELAHLVRRDHWVRWFELAVGALYWWHPILWLARRQLRTTEDVCCDALVIQRCSENDARAYPEALLKVAECCAGMLHPRPSLASGIGTKQQLTRRIEMMVNHQIPTRLKTVVKLGIAVFGIVVLPVSWSVSQQGGEEHQEPESEVTAAEDSPPDANPPEETQPHLATQEDAASFSGKLVQGSRITIRVSGTTPEHPINGVFPVESGGKVSLGPHYGRVAVEGLTVEQAETAIAKYLRENFLQDPKVMVTKWAGAERLEPVTVNDEQIVPGTLLKILVFGTLLEHPIGSVYIVEPGGAVSLGPPYGRTPALVGLSLEEAEASIETHLKKYVGDPKVMVSMWDGAVRLKRVPLPKGPYRIAPGDLLDILGWNTIPDEPICGIYAVEESGKIALGPIYGRVRVAGLSLEDAEEAIKEHLKTTLANPGVSVTLGGWKVQKAPTLSADLLDTSALSRSHLRVGETSPEQVELLRQYVKELTQHHARIKALANVGARGGEADKVSLASYKLASAEAELALAEGRKQDAIKLFEEAVSHADTDVRATESAYDAGTVTQGRLLQAETTLFEAKTRLLRLKKDLLQSKTSQTRNKSALRYAGKDFNEWRDALVNELDVERRKEAIEAVKKFGTHGYAEEAAQALSLVLIDEPQIAHWVAGSLAELGPPAVPGLIKAVEGNNKVTAMHAALALGIIGPDAEVAVPALLAVAKDDHQALRTAVYHALGQIGKATQEVTAALTRGMVEESEYSRRVAGFSLAKIGTAAEAEPAVPILVDYLNDMLTQRQNANIEGLDAHIELVRQKLYGYGRLAAIDFLGQIGPRAKEAIPLLKDLAANKAVNRDLEKVLNRDPEIHMLNENIQRLEAAILKESAVSKNPNSHVLRQYRAQLEAVQGALDLRKEGLLHTLFQNIDTTSAKEIVRHASAALEKIERPTDDPQ